MPGLPISRRHLILTGSALAATAAMPVAARAQAPAPAGTPTDSPLVRQLYGGRWPDDATTRKVYDDFLLQRAVQAYMLTLPALNVIGMRDGSEATFGRGYHVLPIWKDRMGARTWVPTPNCDVVYSMSYLNLKETGPLVVYAPPNVIGMFTDFLQRTLTDVGAAGPDLGRGGLYLLLPPGYDGAVPGGYHAVPVPHLQRLSVLPHGAHRRAERPGYDEGRCDGRDDAGLSAGKPGAQPPAHAVPERVAHPCQHDVPDRLHLLGKAQALHR